MAAIDINAETCIISITRDITERKQAEEAIRQLNAELECRVAERTAELSAANQQLTELDRIRTKFVSDVSHELRTPVTTINMSLYLLERAPDEKRAQYLSRLKGQVQHLTDFVNAILDLSRLDNNRKVVFTTVDLNSVVESVCDSLLPKAELARLDFLCQFGNELPPVNGDSGQLAQVVTNLVANAINYTRAGTIEVCTGQDMAENQVYLSVRDTGIGIPADELPHLFERFYRGSRVSDIPGSGLGLGIVKEIVDRHQGTIEVESQVDVGSVFTVRLPIAQDILPA